LSEGDHDIDWDEVAAEYRANANGFGRIVVLLESATTTSV